MPTEERDPDGVQYERPVRPKKSDRAGRIATIVVTTFGVISLLAGLIFSSGLIAPPRQPVDNTNTIPIATPISHTVILN